ncbi:hypothetical protein AB434_2646 [Heyndrickxia coagulans]|uniref:Uncharacterized protein n=1 Tax=Heyndrickxia coagulans TaxID=1398 RepID=A0AAN0T5S5_HEYCO|nr:hypothetical protein SB48_HM08orf04230 [Heyndrickxia coagulans]AKN55051.1 hypothetical protein AB434_2646 [Heyndrickxia coagulans]
MDLYNASISSTLMPRGLPPVYTSAYTTFARFGMSSSLTPSYQAIGMPAFSFHHIKF